MKIQTLSSIRRTALAASIALGVLGSHAAPASAAIVGERIIVSSNFPMALDVSGASTDKFAKVIQWWPTGSTNQTWAWDHVSGAGTNATYRLQNLNSRMCLTTDGVAGHQLYQYPCQPNNESQMWSTPLDPLRPNLNSDAKISNKMSGLCVDVNGGSHAPGTAIITWYCGSAWNQYWV